MGQTLEKIFTDCPDSVEVKLENFPKYVRRQHLNRFLTMYEIFKEILPVKGSVIECGVYKGFGLMSWAKLSTILEPENLTRRIYGFDTFAGFPSITEKDKNRIRTIKRGALESDSYEELLALLKEYDRDRFLGHVLKVELIKGDIAQTIPRFVKEHPHLVVSLLFIDCDLYEPTKVALEHLLPRMPRGSILAFDELDNPLWPGETLALLETSNMNKLKFRRCPWDPYITYATIS